MSRTEIYNMMENRKNNLSLGSNASDFLSFNNGVGFLEDLNDKFYVEKQNIALQGLDSPTWLELAAESLNPDVADLNTYSLDDILDGKSLMSPECGSDITSDFMETPVASPLSSSDESSYDLEELLLAACPEEVLASKVDSSSVPLAEHTYAAISPVVIDTTENATKDVSSIAELSPMSDDSGFSSGDESLLDPNDILMQLLNGNFDINTVSNAEGSSVPVTVDENAAMLIQEVPPDNEEFTDTKSSRFSPYKKKRKTVEQKQRKKAQNRNAASRYRSKKKNELSDMFQEADELESKNKELRGKVDGLKTEIDYLKNLMLDVIKARLSNGSNSLDVTLSNTLMSS